MYSTILIATSTLITVVSYVVFIRSILAGQAKPHRTTRFLVMLVNIIQTASLIFTGNTVAVWLAGTFAFSNIIIFVLSIKYGLGGWAKLDIVCLVIALLSIVIWKITYNPGIALLFAIAADVTGFIPTIIKSYKRPETEVWLFFGIDAVAATFNLLATKEWTITSIAFPLYIIALDVLLVLLILKPFNKLNLKFKLNG